MNKTDMKKLGFSDRILAESTLYEGLYPARVLSRYQSLYKVACENGELTAEVSGKFRFDAKALSDYPAVGDFVMLDRNAETNGNAIIHHVLSRESAFIRKSAGKSKDEQIVASNIDTVFICMSLNRDFNLRRIERYLSIGHGSEMKRGFLLPENQKKGVSTFDIKALPPIERRPDGSLPRMMPGQRKQANALILTGFFSPYFSTVLSQLAFLQEGEYHHPTIRNHALCQAKGRRWRFGSASRAHQREIRQQSRY